jgi:hypothetical protein
MIILVVAIVAWSINRDKTIVGSTKETLFGTEISKSEIKSFLKAMTKDLDKINSETTWSEHYYTPLDADVEIYSNRGKKIKVKKMVDAIRRDKKTPLFMVIGEPGSGKSVSLRILASKMLQEVEKSNVLPIYIDLKYWNNKYDMCKDNQITGNNLFKFIKEHLGERLDDIFSSEFIEEYFQLLHKRGNLFYIFDSFDEIPELLDEDEHSELIDTYSNALDSLLESSTGTRGILASREFKSPTQKYRATTVYKIKRFDELQIDETIASYTGDKKSKISKILANENQRLFSEISNPFVLKLYVNYLRKEKKKVPKNQEVLYNYYLKDRLSTCEQRLKSARISYEELKRIAIDVSSFMLSNNRYGLEVPLKTLEEQFNQYKIEEAVNILKYAKLMRVGQSEEKRVSFVHRRFCEYYAVQRFIADPEEVRDIYSEAIKNDGKYRDPLVLYCEVDDNRIVEEIAAFCWDNIRDSKNLKDIHSEETMYAIRSLRFMNDAFRYKGDYIKPFRKELYKFLKGIVVEDNSILLKKIAIEALGLLDENQINEIIAHTLRLRVNWLTENILLSCRYVKKIRRESSDLLCKYFDQMTIYELVTNRKRFIFNTSISESLKGVGNHLKLKYLDLLLLIIFGMMCILISPIFATVIIILGVLIALFEVLKKFFMPHKIMSGYLFLKARLYLSFVYTVTVVSQILYVLKGEAFASGIKLGIDTNQVLTSNDLHIVREVFVGYPLVILTILSLFLAIPLYDLFTNFKRIVKVITKKKIIGVIIVLPILFCLLWVMQKLITGNGIFFIMIPFAILLVVLGVSFIRDWWHDRKIMKELVPGTHISRQTIEEIITALIRENAQIDFLEQLQKKSVVVTGTYITDCFLSEVNGYDVAVLLSKLEEKWMCLN